MMTDRELYELDKKVIGREMTNEELELFMRTIHERGFISDEQYERFNGRNKEDKQWMIDVGTFATSLYFIRVHGTNVKRNDVYTNSTAGNIVYG